MLAELKRSVEVLSQLSSRHSSFGGVCVRIPTQATTLIYTHKLLSSLTLFCFPVASITVRVDGRFSCKLCSLFTICFSPPQRELSKSGCICFFGSRGELSKYKHR